MTSRFRAPQRVCLAVLGLVVGGVPAATAIAAPAAATTYTITDLGSLGGSTIVGANGEQLVTRATAINVSGQVTGGSFSSDRITVPCINPFPKKCFEDPEHAFVWTNGTMDDLGTPVGVQESVGVAISDSGEVVGRSWLWNGHNLKSLNGLGDFGTEALGPLGINDSGDVVGQCGFVVAPEVFACEVNTNTGTTITIGDPNMCESGAPGCIACNVAGAINNNGQVLANNCGGSGDREGSPVVWTKGTPTVIGTLGGATTGTAINNPGQVVGTSQTSTGATDGFLWSSGTITDLGSSFAPAAINDSGVIVGGPFVFSNGTLLNLNNLIPAGSPYRILSATGINDHGQIVANALDTATNQERGLLLTPN
jgi:probable HAF family extracellular repeat protein